MIGFRCEQSARFYVKKRSGERHCRLDILRNYLASSYANIENL
uniref:Uncharacterized protein n=2 Tax=Vibrio TaxID=662 RepID=A0A0H3ZS95_9VIBR|nr:hypothetical protein [Vibrio tasmaniensis]AKN36525.1 hypothetical protein [Vibrio tasmaniensis]AKN38123.1 hypothetical protein [Vibrio tasmaniensis]AKN38359.1 hypothetical protein [Vibrio sp. FF_371]AKN39120.1 hypothetical protein [Vibrio tasmaniensis]